MQEGRERQSIVGNRMVLIGAVMYLLEWVAIAAGQAGAPVGPAGSSSDVVATYTGHETGLGWAAGWFSVVLLGRILVMTGLRAALTDSGRPDRLLDFGIAAMAVGVALEIATYGLAAGTAWFASHGGGAAEVGVLDSATSELNGMILGPTGVAALVAGIAMWRSRLFGRVLPVLALLPGVVLVVVGLALAAPSLLGPARALSAVLLLFWGWMLWTGILLWRRVPRSGASSETPSV
jgi:hypothetical protein